MDEVRKSFRLHHYSYRTEESYLHWIRRFIVFNEKRHPREMGPDEIQRFLSDLATRGRVSASTQNQALSALLFLYKKVLQMDLPWLDDIVRAKRPVRVVADESVTDSPNLVGGANGPSFRPFGLSQLIGRLVEFVATNTQDGAKPETTFHTMPSGTAGSVGGVASASARAPKLVSRSAASSRPCWRKRNSGSRSLRASSMAGSLPSA